MRSPHDMSPFPKNAPSQRQQAEDAFMQEHGGRGATALYWIVTRLSDLAWVIASSPGRFRETEKHVGSAQTSHSAR